MVQAMSLRLQLLLLQAVIVCLVTAATGMVAVNIQERVIRDQTGDRMRGVALSMSRQPAILEALETRNPAARIQPIAEFIRKSSNLTYVVVTDSDGIRHSHPNPERIGERVSTDPSVPLSGRIYEGRQTGTLGESWRVKVPIWAEGASDAQGGEVIGSVSVGVLESELAADVRSWLPWVIAAVAGSALIGVFGAAWVTAIVRRRIFQLEPGEIAELVKEHETMLHRLSEGVVTVDALGVITVANDAACRLLDRDDLVGLSAQEVLDAPVLAVLEEGEPDGRIVLAGERAIIARGTGVVDDHGTPVSGTLLLRDHTELHQALREMDGANSLTDGLRAQAHEFANSMHVVSGLLELELIEDARDYIARIRPGGALVDADAALVGGGISALLSVKTAQAHERGIAVALTSHGEIPAVLHDDLVTILGNLVDNALEACAVGDRVEITLAADAAEVAVVIDDSGPGIPAEVSERIFEEGVSTRSDGAHHRGIGLALVARVVRRRDGQIRFDRSELGGARFEVRLPVKVRVP